MFIERANSKKYSSLQRSETEIRLVHRCRNIALRWSAGRSVPSDFYKHLAPLEPGALAVAKPGALPIAKLLLSVKRSQAEI